MSKKDHPLNPGASSQDRYLTIDGSRASSPAWSRHASPANNSLSASRTPSAFSLEVGSRRRKETEDPQLVELRQALREIDKRIAESDAEFEKVFGPIKLPKVPEQPSGGSFRREMSTPRKPPVIGRQGKPVSHRQEDVNTPTIQLFNEDDGSTQNNTSSSSDVKRVPQPPKHPIPDVPATKLSNTFVSEETKVTAKMPPLPHSARPQKSEIELIADRFGIGVRSATKLFGDIVKARHESNGAVKR